MNCELTNLDCQTRLSSEPVPIDWYYKADKVLIAVIGMMSNLMEHEVVEVGWSIAEKVSSLLLTVIVLTAHM